MFRETKSVYLVGMPLCVRFGCAAFTTVNVGMHPATSDAVKVPGY